MSVEILTEESLHLIPYKLKVIYNILEENFK